MSAQTNAMPEAGFGAAVAAPARVTRPMYWSVRRELWENWWLWGAPMAAAGLIVLGTLVAAFHGMIVARSAGDQQTIIAGQWGLVGVLIMLSTFLVAVFYCVDALYGERRDRSILFWRSLPVSDTVAVLAKASVPVVILPIVTFVIAFVTQWIVLGIDAATLMAHGQSLTAIGQLPLFTMQGELLYHLVTVHALWYAPIYAWFLLVSAWARRVPLLWAFLTPLVIGLVEKIAFGTTYFGQWIGGRIMGGPSGGAFGPKGVMLHSMAAMTPGRFFASAGLWGGLIVAAVFLAAAVQLRRYRAPN